MAEAPIYISPLRTSDFVIFAPTAITVYVSTTGSDALAGATPATAVRTVDRAIGIVQSRGWNLSASIRLLPGLFPLAGGRVIRGDGAPGARSQLLVIEGDSLAQLAAHTVLGAALVGNLAEVTVAAPVTPAADGERARFTSGALSGQSFIVGNVGGFTFTIMTNAVPAPGDTLVLEATTAAIAITTPILFTGGPRLLRNVGVILPPTTGPLPALLLVDSTLLMSGVHLTTGTPAGSFIVLARSTVAAGQGIAGIPGVEPNPLGVAITGFGGPNIGVLCQLAGSFPLQNSYLRDAQLLATTSGVVSLGQTLCLRTVLSVSDGANWSSDSSRYLDGPGDGLSASGAVARLSGVDVSNSGGSGVYLTNSDVRLDTSVTSLTPNANTGVRVDAQGRVTVAGAGTTVTISGAANPDVVIGASLPATWVDLAAALAPNSDFSALFPLFASVAMV